MSDDWKDGTPLEDGEIKDLVNKFYRNGLQTLSYRRYRGMFMPRLHSKYSELIENFECRNDDVWVIGFPKSGTFWTQEMVWCIANDLDYEGAKKDINERYNYFEGCSIFDFLSIVEEKMPDYKAAAADVTNSVSVTDKMASPRFLKSHLHWNSLPKQIRDGQKTPKIIYAARNAKDVCISFYHHSVRWGGYKGNFEDFCKLFLNDALTYAPYWQHIAGYWENKALPNVLFLTYEDMKKDLPSVINQVADFFGKTLSKEQVDRLSEHLSFNSMKENPAVNLSSTRETIKNIGLGDIGNHMRQGTGGEWKSKMSPKIIQEFDSWIYKNSIQAGMDVWNTGAKI